jgi:hypothetical protein
LECADASETAKLVVALNEVVVPVVPIVLVEAGLVILVDVELTVLEETVLAGLEDVLSAMLSGVVVVVVVLEICVGEDDGNIVVD